jgi:uncharacterized protein YggE
MKNIKNFVLLIAFIALPVYAQYREPQIRFDVIAQKDIKANAVELNFTLEKKKSNLQSATNEMNDLVVKVKKIAENYKIPSADIQIQRTFINASDWIFGKDYVVSSTAKITIRNMEIWTELAKKLTQIDKDMAFTGISYGFPKTEDHWQALLKQAIDDMQIRKASYEKLLNQKLHISLIREMRLRPYDQPQIRVFSKSDSPESAQASMAADMSQLLPTQVMQLNLDIGLDPAN